MAAFALLFQIAGTLDGATVFTMPNPLPAPTAGVTIIPVAGNLGILDLLAGDTQDSPTAYWLRTLNIECSAATAAVRINQLITGSAAARTALLQQSPANPVMPRLSTFEPRIMPKGTRLNLLNDSVSAAFGGVPVAGPHRLYIEIDPIGDTDTLLDIYEQTSSEQLYAQTQQQQGGQTFQAVAASLSQDLIIPPNCTRLVGVRITNGAVAAAGESMTFAISRVRGGATQTLMTASPVIDATIAANSVTDFSSTILRQFADWLVPGTDTIRVARTYVAGGGPTPMTNTNCQLIFAP